MNVRQLTSALSQDFQRNCIIFNNRIYLEGFKRVISVPSIKEYYEEMLQRTKCNERAFNYVYDAVTNLFYGNSVVREHDEELRNEG